MSGTSLDGVDAVLVDFDGNQPQVRGRHYAPYPLSIRQRCLSLQNVGHDELHQSSMLAQDLARLYANTVNEMLVTAHIAPQHITAIGCHGQTIRHNPGAGYTLQLNQPALLVELTGIPVVADFRSRDIAAGGQGAPLVPAFHDAVFRHPDHRRVVVNIGGIANLTDLRPGGNTQGYDCGPGNMLMDAWIAEHQDAQFDRDGAWARQGHTLPNLLDALRAHPFFATQPPKSCGREEFNLAFLRAHLKGDEKASDVQRTLLELTAVEISRAVGQTESNTEVLLCGGGAHNTLLTERLSALLPLAEVKPTDTLGVSADLVESIAFAWLARETWAGRPGNLPAVTGAKGPRVLGAIYPA